VVNIDVSVGGRLGDITGKGVDDAFKWKDGEGISITDRTVYDLCVHEEMFYSRSKNCPNVWLF
jgi:hypothetical protein